MALQVLRAVASADRNLEPFVSWSISALAVWDTGKGLLTVSPHTASSLWETASSQGTALIPFNGPHTSRYTSAEAQASKLHQLQVGIFHYRLMP
jgi:hypothetical protein